MKKNILLLTTLFLFSVAIQSQVLITLLLGDKLNSEKLEFGLESGVNFETINGMESTDRKAFFNIGFYFDFTLKNPHWSAYTGVLVKANQGLGNLTDNDLDFLGVDKQLENSVEIAGEYNQVINTFVVPVLMKYHFKNYIYLEGGMQFGLRYKSYVEFNSDNKDVEERVRYINRDAVQKIDAGFLGGLGYQFKKGKGWTVGAKYYYGLVDVYKDRSGTNSNSFFIKVNVPIGVKKSKEKAAKEQAKKDKEALEDKNAELQKRIEELEKQ
ncbi:MAG: hypothetical protein COB73_08370 [Flavobacteriaceae bacterium]|nr:MAG: hypothetical protein COB73_08370 [Flavobacteriaceae bacterium]